MIIHFVENHYKYRVKISIENKTVKVCHCLEIGRSLILDNTFL